MANHSPSKYRTEMINKRFGRLVVIEEIPKEERKKANEREFICKCDCGNIRRVKIPNLKSGNTKSCGCLEKELITKRNVEKIVGKRFGRLVAIDYERDYLKPNRYRYICRCDCGNIHKVIATDLNRRFVMSCGCLRKENSSKKSLDDITGKTFGELTAIRRVEDFVGRGNYRRTQWLFKCSCGNEIKALAVNVKHGKTLSCGHLGNSIAESKIADWLKQYNIPFEKEKGFNDLRNPETGRKLLFDFMIKRADGSVFAIEHQGSQHFTNRDTWFGKQQREQTDKMKKDYCNAKGIKLYETRYDEDYIAKLEEIIGKELGQEGVAYVEGVKCG